ncbi:MAG: DNA methylase [Candidatus Limivivens sp.]|nr:DNA methylase [Candidatus Limivivens sp.]
MDQEKNAKDGGRVYAAVDLKSFYASVECHERNLSPLETNLVVADLSRTEKTICLAVSPSLKRYGISGRARLFEVVQRVDQVNRERLQKAPGRRFTAGSYDKRELEEHPEYKLEYIVAPPRMALYIEYSTRIYDVYLKYIAPEDIHVYSIDEVMMDLTSYLSIYAVTAEQLVKRIVKDIYETTGITATAGIGTNLYLCKVAMDIVAKHVEPDEDGVRIARLDEMSYRQLLWDHTPITDFWRVGPGYARKLREHGMYTMGDVARCSAGAEDSYQNEELLYRLFGVNAELLIDHAWGWEPCTIAEIRAYQPETKSICSGQVLHCPYEADKARIVTVEMADALSLDLVSRRQVTDQLVLTIGYDSKSLETPGFRYEGKIRTNHYGKKVPEHAHGTINLQKKTSSAKQITQAVRELYDRIIDSNLLIRRISLSANRLEDEEEARKAVCYEQYDLFTDYAKLEKQREEEKAALEKERKLQEAMLDIKNRFGKNAVLKGTNFLEGATARERNKEIGGHKA